MVDPRIVIPVAAGSSPVLHPSKSFWRKWNNGVLAGCNPVVVKAGRFDPYFLHQVHKIAMSKARD